MSRIYADRVMETTTSTGTGDIALSAAVPGFQRFSAVMVVGDTCEYSIFETDAAGTPTGAWETGLGTYSATNTLTRSVVQGSSNAGAAVNFASGFKWVMLSENAQTLRNIGLTTLSKVSLLANSSTIIFSSIPQVYEDIVLVLVGRGAASSNTVDVNLILNGDTSAVYAFQNIAGSATVNNNYGATRLNNTFVGRIPAATGPASAASSLELTLPGYAGTTFTKSGMSKGGSRGDSAASSLFGINVWFDWANTSAITDIILVPSVGDFLAGTRAVLYGRGG